MSEENDEPRSSRVRYRIQIRTMRHGKVGRTRMYVCQNFRVDRYKNLMYTDLKGDFVVIPLEHGEYFDVKVMAG